MGAELRERIPGWRRPARALATAALAVGLTSGLAGCAGLAVWSAPPKAAAGTRSEAALKADALFWKTLHDGDYDGIERALTAVKAAYLQTPNDAITAAHTGWLHIWRLAERARRSESTPAVTDDIALSRRYFEEAVKLVPDEARFLGFYASTLLAEASIHDDEKLRRRGYYTMLDAIDAWPEFNLFTAGYVMSSLPADSPRFAQALEWQWRTLDLCAGEKVDRQQASFATYMPKETTEGRKRVCWNSWIAPHNFEGFFLNMGDMLVKSGDWQTAQRIYANAKLSRTYGEWAYAPVLERRITDAQQNVAHFSAPPEGADRRHRVTMSQSTFACMGCHQR